MDSTLTVALMVMAVAALLGVQVVSQMLALV